jgi:hypothetical protein
LIRVNEPSRRLTTYDVAWLLKVSETWVRPKVREKLLPVDTWVAEGVNSEARFSWEGFRALKARLSERRATA